MKLSGKSKTILKYVIAIAIGIASFATISQFVAYLETVKTVIASTVLWLLLSTGVIYSLKWLGLFHTFTEDEDPVRSQGELIAGTAIICTIFLSIAIFITGVLCGAFLGV